MLTVHNISKSFGIEAILREVSFNINPGERLGLVGPNGCGKTTLLRILTGEEKADSGAYHFNPPNLQIGYLPQGLSPAEDETITSFLTHAVGDLNLLTSRVETYATQLVETPDQPALQQAYDDTLAAIQTAELRQEQLPPVLAALELDKFASDTPVHHLSGGQKTRLALAVMLLSAPKLLFLDEPTNHLDFQMLEWLENWLVSSPMTRNSAALIVSHDRVFLDNTVTGILEIDPISHRLRAYTGNYSAYLDEKLRERERHWQSYTDQNEQITRLHRAAVTVRGQAAFKRGGKGDSGDKFARGFFSDQSRRQVARAKHLERRLEKLLKDERIDKPALSWQMKLDFDHVHESSRQVLVSEDLAIGYDNNRLLEGLDLSLRYGQRLVLIGPNGSGKTTLLRTIAGELSPLAGRLRLGSSAKPGFMTQEQETLDPHRNALDTILMSAPLSETEARSFLHLYLFSGDDVFVPIGNLSYGERARLMLASLVARGCNLLLLDEPINHLDIPSRARFEQALASFAGTIIAVVHDRYFIKSFATALWEVRQGKLLVIPQDYIMTF
jgi:ATP-binding cassette subfamily F protein 3